MSIPTLLTAAAAELRFAVKTLRSFPIFSNAESNSHVLMCHYCNQKCQHRPGAELVTHNAQYTLSRSHWDSGGFLIQTNVKDSSYFLVVRKMYLVTKLVISEFSPKMLMFLMI